MVAIPCTRALLTTLFDAAVLRFSPFVAPPCFLQKNTTVVSPSPHCSSTNDTHSGSVLTPPLLSTSATDTMHSLIFLQQDPPFSASLRTVTLWKSPSRLCLPRGWCVFFSTFLALPVLVVFGNYYNHPFSLLVSTPLPRPLPTPPFYKPLFLDFFFAFNSFFVESFCLLGDVGGAFPKSAISESLPALHLSSPLLC